MCTIKINFKIITLIDPVLEFLLQSLQHKDLGSAASIALQNICIACPTHMPSRFQGLLGIAENLENYTINSEAAIGLLKGIKIYLKFL